MKTLVLGIGNGLLTDEAAGIHTLNHLIKRHAPLREVEFLDGGTLSFVLATDVEQADQLIVIDAAELHLPPGSIRCFENADMDAHLGAARRSVHEVGLLDLLDIARLTEHLPPRRALVGIQPQTIEWGLSPTDTVSAAIPSAAAMVMELIERWAGDPLPVKPAPPVDGVTITP